MPGGVTLAHNLGGGQKGKGGGCVMNFILEGWRWGRGMEGGGNEIGGERRRGKVCWGGGWGESRHARWGHTDSQPRRRRGVWHHSQVGSDQSVCTGMQPADYMGVVGTMDGASEANLRQTLTSWRNRLQSILSYPAASAGTTHQKSGVPPPPKQQKMGGGGADFLKNHNTPVEGC